MAQDAPLLRSLLPTRLVCIALSRSGRYLAGGTVDGQVFFWETATGALLAAFSAHFRSVSALAWTTDDAALLSGGEDAAAHVWSIASCVGGAGPL